MAILQGSESVKGEKVQRRIENQDGSQGGGGGGERKQAKMVWTCSKTESGLLDEPGAEMYELCGSRKKT